MKNKSKKLGSSKEKKSKDIISTRKACYAGGTGLSHFILMDKKGK